MTIAWRIPEKPFRIWVDQAGLARIRRMSRIPTDSNERLPPPDTNSWIRKGKSYMDDHFIEDITVDRVAEYLNVHRSYLTRKFTEQYRASPKQYLHRLRMEHAAGLLRGTSLSIAEIADILHYSDAFSFSRAYKNYYQQAPSLSRRSSTK